MSEHEDNSGGQHAEAPSARAQGSELGNTSAIGRRLKAYYDDVASEPVPDRFLSLLDALDAAAGADATGERGSR